MSAAPRTSRGTPWRGELLTCRDCSAQHPDRDDVADAERCPKAVGRRWWHRWNDVGTMTEVTT
jgi:hypothetical protein